MPGGKIKSDGQEGEKTGLQSRLRPLRRPEPIRFPTWVRAEKSGSKSNHCEFDHKFRQRVSTFFGRSAGGAAENTPQAGKSPPGPLPCPSPAERPASYPRLTRVRTIRSWYA